MPGEYPGKTGASVLLGGSAIEASKIAGHSDLEMTSEYTFVTAERQNERTRRIQQKLAKAGKRLNEQAAGGSAVSETVLNLTAAATPSVQ